MTHPVNAENEQLHTALMIDAFASGKMLQIIFYVLLMAPEALPMGVRIKGFFDVSEFMKVSMMKLVTLVIRLPPIGTFAILARTFTQQDTDLTLPTGSQLLATILSMNLHFFGVMMVGLCVLGRLSPRIFKGKVCSALMFPFSTHSSNATIPITHKCRHSVSAYNAPRRRLLYRLVSPSTWTEPRSYKA